MLGQGETVDELQTLLQRCGFALQTLEFRATRDLARFVEQDRELIAGVTNVVAVKRSA